MFLLGGSIRRCSSYGAMAIFFVVLLLFFRCSGFYSCITILITTTTAAAAAAAAVEGCEKRLSPQWSLMIAIMTTCSG